MDELEQIELLRQQAQRDQGPDDLLDQQRNLSARQKMAMMLMGQNQQPQGQMISGQYVAPNWAQQLTPVVNQLAGAYLTKQAEDESSKIARQLRQGKMAAEQEVMNAMSPTPAKVTELAGPAYKGQAPVAIQEAKGPDWAKALAATNNPYGAGKELRSHILKQMNPEDTAEYKNFLKAQKDGYPGTFIQYQNRMNDYQRAQLANERARMVDEGILGGGGVGYSGGAMPAGRSMPGGAQATGGAPAMVPGATAAGPTAGPVPFQYDPRLTPKENRRLLAESQTLANEGQQAKYKAAVDSADIIKQVATLLPKSTSGGLNEDIKSAKAYLNMPTTTSPQDAQLKVLGAKLVASVPRFKGADSDKDVAQYMAAAGDVANSRLPWTDRMAAVKQIYDLNKKYAPDAYAGYSDEMFAAQPVQRPKISDTGRILKEQFTTTQGFRRIN